MPEHEDQKAEKCEPLRVVAEVLVGYVGESGQQKEDKKPPLPRPGPAQQDDREERGKGAAQIGGGDEGRGKIERRARTHLRGRHRPQVAEIGSPVADPPPGRDACRDDEAGDDGGQKHLPLVAQEESDEDRRAEGHRVGDLDHHEPRDAKPHDRPVDEWPGSPEGPQHRERDGDEGQSPGPPVVMHRDRDRVDGLAVNEGCGQDQADKAEGIGQPPGKPGPRCPPHERQKTEGHARLGGVDRLVDPDTAFHEAMDRQEGKGADRRHEIEMGGFTALEPEENFQQMQHVALVAGDEEAALEKRHRGHGHDEAGENRQQDDGIWSAHPSELPFFGHIRRRCS